MFEILAGIAGGVGLFLLGMILMTDGLKALAGAGLRRVLENFTGNRFSAAATGALTTAVVQSSSATTLATIGFVSAGLLSFGNAIGVVIEAIAARRMDPEEALMALAAQRWLDRIAYRSWRICHHLREMTRADARGGKGGPDAAADLPGSEVRDETNFLTGSMGAVD